MDFYKLEVRSTKRGVLEVYPNFLVKQSKDLMLRGGAFYAVWDKDNGIWSTDEFRLVELVDREIMEKAAEVRSTTDDKVIAMTLGDFTTGVWQKFKQYTTTCPDSFEQLDNQITYQNTVIKPYELVSKRLPYSLNYGDYSAYDELMGTLYSPEERRKIEWAIGAIISGDSKKIQKFLVLYGQAGSGKSTVLNIIQNLFEGYYKAFDAQPLGKAQSQFAMEIFQDNPLLAIQHDGDLSKIDDNSRLNSITSHEEMVINAKYKAPYMARINAFLFMGTNKPVKITDSKSGIIRRLIDVHPSGQLIPAAKYHELMARIEFELGAVAQHCLDVYTELGKNYYSGYKPLSMMYQTDALFNFVEENYYIFKNENGISLKRAWDMYNEYMEDGGFAYRLNKMTFKEELKDYFTTFHDQLHTEDVHIRNYYEGFLFGTFNQGQSVATSDPQIGLARGESLLDVVLASMPAQYSTDAGTPSMAWDSVTTTLSDLDTSKEHYVMVPENHIVIDFDLKDSEGNKSRKLNLAAASKFPPTYTELSRGGEGVHLHYIYDGDVTKLSRIYSDDIEVKVFLGKSSLRRRLSECNNMEITTISSGLPLKEEKVIDFEGLKNEKSLRTLIGKNLHKEIHPGTKPSVDFIGKILDDAFYGGMEFDVSDMRPAVLNFAMSSTNHSGYCVKQVNKMRFSSSDKDGEPPETGSDSDNEIVFFDVEVFPNLFVVCWKFQGEDHKTVRMINPTAQEIEELCEHRLIGFNNRRYDNHILYARMLGIQGEELYKVSKAIIEGSKNATFAQAYGLSYTDIYDFSSKKQSLKRFEIELGVHHQELGLPWDEPVDANMFMKVAEYCENDVVATEAVFNARKADFIAREILADISGLSVNDTTQKHTAKIIFGADRNPQKKFVYTDLSKDFPGYKYDRGISTYRDEVVGEGGYVYAEPGIHRNVALLDIASMHPTSIIELNAFGPYTGRFKELLDARLAIKHGDYNAASGMLNGALAPYLTEDSNADELAYALKIVINIVYGLTSAKFPNAFKDDRNVDNIVAKRGALFMIDLKHAVQEKGYTVAHIKTDSIKIPDADEEIIKFVSDFGRKYGYTFEHEATYDRMCLVNDAVYVAYEPEHGWTATGAQFKHPYVFKTLFTGEPIEKKDISETKTTKSSFYLDFNESLEEYEHRYAFIGRAGAFTPVIDGQGGGLLMREQDGKMYSATGAKGYRWLETEVVDKDPDIIVDFSYGDALATDAIDTISAFGSYEEFVAV